MLNGIFCKASSFFCADTMTTSSWLEEGLNWIVRDSLLSGDKAMCLSIVAYPIAEICRVYRPGETLPIVNLPSASVIAPRFVFNKFIDARGMPRDEASAMVPDNTSGL